MNDFDSARVEIQRLELAAQFIDWGMSSREPPHDLPGSRPGGYDQNSSQA
ncbi:MAG TPA: hypothetical protein VHM66_13320 [Solirubrobacterales bacterium]|nr:hypothetical protein [Solirubrobacterales bacterium]